MSLIKTINYISLVINEGVSFFFFYFPNADNIAAPNATAKTIYIPITMAAHIKAAFAQLALFGLVSLPKAQIKSIIIPTSGMAAIK